MSRAATLLGIVLCTAAVALPAAARPERASAPHGANATGSIVALTTSAVTVKTARGTVTCSFAARSPSAVSFATGQRVRIACTGPAGHLILTKLRHVGFTTTAANDDAATRFGGVITSLSGTSITLHDGDRDLTCAIDSTSPSTATLAVGSHVNVACAGGTLVSWAPVTANAPGRAYLGTLATIGTDSVSVDYAGGVATCTVGAGSPSLTGFSEGDQVLMGCSIPAGQLVLLRHSTTTTPAPPTPPVTTADQTTKGTITALGGGTVTVHNTEHGDLTCTSGPGSPGLAGFSVGELAGMGCKDNVLVIIVALGSGNGGTPPPPTTTTPSTPPPPTATVDQTTKGTITALGDGSITIHNAEHGDLTCTTGPQSPSLAGFSVGEQAGMGCLDGVLVLVAQPAGA